MQLAHASYSFPTEIVIWLEVALAVGSGLALLLAPGLFARTIPAIWRRIGRVGASRRASLLLVVLLALLGNGLTHLLLGPPLPTVSDEEAYLLQAETFASGRLTNPPPQLPETVRMENVLDAPTRQSKYPPAQALLLAPGVALDHPELSLVLGSVLLAAATLWALRGWTAPAWALAGTLLVVLRLGIGSYWNQSYWGGTVAAIGGALLLGTLARWQKEGPRPLLAATTVAGLALLANSRPYEGALFSLVVAAAVLSSTWAGRRRRRDADALVTWGSIALGGVVVVAAMAWYHRAVTGSPWVMPHALYTESRMPGSGHFLWSSSEVHAAGPATALRLGLERLGFDLRLSLGLLLSPIALRAAARVRSARWPALAAGAVVVGDALTGPWFVHYAAPATVAFVLLGVLGAEDLRATRFRGVELGPWAMVVTLATFFVVTVVEMPAHRADPNHPSRLRPALDARLEELAGRDLVLVDRRLGPWIVNGPTPLEQEVVWLRDVDSTSRSGIRRAFPDRIVWRLDLEPSVRLVREVGEIAVEPGIPSTIELPAAAE